MGLQAGLRSKRGLLLFHSVYVWNVPVFPSVRKYWHRWWVAAVPLALHSFWLCLFLSLWFCPVMLVVLLCCCVVVLSCGLHVFSQFSKLYHLFSWFHYYNVKFLFMYAQTLQHSRIRIWDKSGIYWLYTGTTCTESVSLTLNLTVVADLRVEKSAGASRASSRPSSAWAPSSSTALSHYGVAS